MQTTCQDALPDTWKHDSEFVHDIKCGALTCEGLAHMSSVDYCSKDFLSGDLSKCVNSTDGRLQDFCRWSCKNCGERLFKIAMASYLIIMQALKFMPAHQSLKLLQIVSKKE